MSGHTPGPWEVLPEYGGPVNIVSEYEEKGGRASANWIAECDLQSDEDQNRANAEFIVRACNVHEELLAAAKAALSVGEIHFKTCVLSGQVHEQLAAAIAKAEGR